MGKKRAVNKVEKGRGDTGRRDRALSKLPKKKILKGKIFIESSSNNTRILFTETNGNVVMWSTSSSIGFDGTKKSTPYAAQKVAETIAKKAVAIGVKDIDLVIKGVGDGRESAIRSFLNRGFNVLSITDRTPVPHNGPRRRGVRRI